MRVPGKLLKGLGVVLALLIVAALAVRTWVVPAVIVGQIRARTGGDVRIRDWWLNRTSAGVVGLTVREAPGASAPVWASARRVTTDLTLGGLLRGRLAPGKIRIESPEVALRFDARGGLATRIGGASAGKPGAIPVVVADGAKLTLQQEGRPAMVVTGVTARIGPDAGKVILSARSNDPNWGRPEVHAEFDDSFKTGNLGLKTTAALTASPEKARAIPFVPADVWRSVAPTGDLGIDLSVTTGGAQTLVRTEITFLKTDVRSETLDLIASATTGKVVVDGAVVTFRDLSGRAIDGRVTVNGKADFAASPTKFDLNLNLDRINVADAPKSWQLDEAGITGRLSGRVRLVALLEPGKVDLSGTSGEAVVEGGVIQGIPFKSLKLVMNATGNDLRYDTPKDKDATSTSPTGALRTPSRFLTALAATAIQARDAKPAGEKEKAKGTAKDEGKPDDKPARPAIQLPKTISTHLELEDVELAQLIARAQFLLGFPFPVPVTGRLTLKADATIPLGKLKNLDEYAFHGDLTLTRASAFKVDLGRVSARVDLADGVVVLSDLRGRLVDHPDGGYDNPPQSSGEAVPAEGPLPPGAFRGSLRAAFSPPGKLSARFEGNRLPLGELSAPALPRPTPLSGLATMNLRAEADLGKASDPSAWDVSGTAQSEEIRYRGAALDAVSVRFGLNGGRLDVSELTALLRQRPLKGRLAVDLKAPKSFQGTVDVAGWDLSEVLAWVPAAPRPAPVSGTLSARAEASGTLEPLAFKTEGRGSFERFQAGPVTLGAVPFHWTTRDDAVDLAVTDARPFGGRVTAEANIPLHPGKPVSGTATVDAIDTAALSAATPGGGVKMSGRASGKVTFSVPADVSALEASVQLSAPDLTVQGLPAEQVKASVKAHRGALKYEVSADSLGGVIRFNGEFPLGARPVRREADGELRAVGFSLDRVWRALGQTGAVSRLTGRGAVDANLRAILGGHSAGLYAHGVAELRDLRWVDALPIGQLRGILMLTPGAWRVDPISGYLLGGDATGVLWGSGSGPEAEGVKREVGFHVEVARAPLRAAAAYLSGHGVKVDGFASLRVAGTLGEVVRAAGELDVPSARVGGLPVSGLKVPAELTTTPGNGPVVLHVRRFTGRMAGGSVHGDARLHLGSDRAFQSHIVLSDVDLESIARIESEARRPASGKLSGRVSLSGHDLALTRSYRGKVNLTLDDASLVALPIFRELDKFLGSARGGLFEAGDLAGTIVNRQIVIETATLEGRLAQLHVTGTVGFDGQLNLEVLVNTNQIIPQTGAALASAIPGLRGAAGRNRGSTLEVTNFLSNKLLKLRVTGTLKSPSVNIDPGIVVAQSAVGFFSGVLKLPLGLVK